MTPSYYAIAKRRGGYGILAVYIPRNADGARDHSRRLTQSWTGEVFRSQSQAEDVIRERNGCRRKGANEGRNT